MDTRSSADDSELARRAREDDSAGLLELLQEHGDELDVPIVRQLLRNPFTNTEVIALLLEHKQLLAAYEVRRDLVLNPRTPEAVALRYVPGLYWRDLVRVSTELRVRPNVRRASERYMATRLPSLTLGERIAAARLAGVGLLPAISRDPHPRVFAAVLQNPRLTQDLLLPVLRSEATAPELLELVTRSYSWRNRYTVRLALVRNRRTPLARALEIVSTLTKGDLRSLARDQVVPAPVRQRARLLLGEGMGRN